MDNRFIQKFKKYSDLELQKYINTPADYDNDAVLAAIQELKSRQGIVDNSEEALSFIHQEEKQEEELLLHSLGIPAKTVSATTRIGHYSIDIFVINVMLLVVNIIPFISISQLFIFVLFPIYYIVMEYNFQWTVGKYITDSIVVDKNGNAPSLKTIILRTFFRHVPLEFLSCIGKCSYGWHDRWSKTYVIHKNDVEKLSGNLLRQFGQDLEDK